MDPQKAWQQILDLIKEQIPSGNFRTWFKDTALSSMDEQNMVIAVPSAFIQEQLVARYQRQIEQAVNQIIGHELVVGYKVDSSLIPVKKGNFIESEAEISFDLPSAAGPAQNLTLNSKYTLEAFVVGLTNNLAYAAAHAIVQSPGTTYNPLFIYGPSGVGKTHLMQAIGNALFKKNPYLKLVYASSERFMVDFVDSIQTKRTGDFRAKYRNCDLLLVDDIQFISGKDSTQEEFFHTFNELHGKNAQVVLTSDRPPHEIQKLEARLSSRFQGGLMVDIQLPDFDTRMAILKAKLYEKNQQMPEELLKLIAENVESNTRELEGKLTQVLQFSLMNNKPLTEELLMQFLGKSQMPKTANLDHRKVISGINHYFNLKMADLTGPRRQKELVIPRQIAMYILYAECKLPMERIGQLLGGRDHTTVLHGVKKIEASIQRDREVQRLVIEVKQSLSAG